MLHVRGELGQRLFCSKIQIMEEGMMNGSSTEKQLTDFQIKKESEICCKSKQKLHQYLFVS